MGYTAPGPGSVAAARGGIQFCVKNEKRVETPGKKENVYFCGQGLKKKILGMNELFSEKGH